MDIQIEQSPREIMMDKLLKDEEINMQDVDNLGLFNRTYIGLLFQGGPNTVRGKMLEVMTRSSVVTFDAVKEG